MLLGKTIVQRINVPNVLLVCLASDIEKGVAICLSGLR